MSYFGQMGQVLWKCEEADHIIEHYLVCAPYPTPAALKTSQSVTRNKNPFFLARNANTCSMVENIFLEKI